MNNFNLEMPRHLTRVWKQPTSSHLVRAAIRPPELAFGTLPVALTQAFKATVPPQRVLKSSSCFPGAGGGQGRSWLALCGALGTECGTSPAGLPVIPTDILMP